MIEGVIADSAVYDLFVDYGNAYLAVNDTVDVLMLLSPNVDKAMQFVTRGSYK